MESRDKGINPLVAIIIAICLIIFTVAAIAAAFKLARRLWEQGPVLCLATHGVVGVSGGLLYLLPGGWWSWVVGAPFIVWAVIVTVIAIGVFGSWMTSLVRQLVG